MFNCNVFGGGLSRRDALKLAAAGVTGVSLSGWLGVLAGRAAATQARHKACILLWMDGGPSHKDTFDLKPGTAQGGPYQEIATSVLSSSPRSRRSVTRALIAGSTCCDSARTRLKLFWCVSQPPSVTSTKETPVSISRRASRHESPKRVSP